MSGENDLTYSGLRLKRLSFKRQSRCCSTIRICAK